MADDTDPYSLDKLRAARQQLINNQPVPETTPAPEVTTDAPTVAGSDAPTIEQLQAARKAIQVRGGITPPADPPASPPVTTATGVAKNVAAGVLDTVANTGNTVADPFSYLVGRPLLMGGAFVHDAIAPYVGWNRLTDADRAALYGGNSEFADPTARMEGGGRGNQLVDAAGRVVNTVADALGSTAPDVKLADVKANTPLEAAARNVTGAVGSTLAMVPGAIPAVSAATGALVGQAAASSPAVPDWAKDATSMAANVATGTATGAAIPAGRAVLTSGRANFPTALTAQMAHDDFGIDVPATQLGMSLPMQGLNTYTKYAPFSGYGSDAEHATMQFHDALATELGQGFSMGKNTRVTQPILDNAVKNSTAERSAAEAEPANPGMGYSHDIATIETQAKATLPKADSDTVVNLINSTIQNGGSYGDALASVRSAMQNPGVPAGVKHFAAQIESSMQKDLTGTLMARDPDGAGMDYMMALQHGRAAQILGSIKRSANGDFDPQEFHAAVEAAKQNGTVPPGSDLDKLGRIAALMPPSAGSASKGSNLLQTGLKLAESAVAGGIGHAVGGLVPGAVPALAVNSGLGRLSSMYLRSDALRDRMINRGTYPDLTSMYYGREMAQPGAINPLIYTPAAANQASNPLSGSPNIPTIYVTPKRATQ